jgi:hypothetical protein
MEEFQEEQEEKIGNQRHAIASIVTGDHRDEKMRQEETELLAKLKEANLANSEYAPELEAINERVKQAAENEANPFRTFATLQNDIAEGDKRRAAEEKAQQEALEAERRAQEESEAEQNTEETPVEETPVVEPTEAPAEEPKKKTSLQSLLSSAKKLKK